MTIAGALAHFEIAIRNARSCPAPILAKAYLEAARLHERAGRRADAIAHLPHCHRRSSAPLKKRATPPRARSRDSTKP